MKIDGINLINDSSVTDARIENGDSLPTINSEDEGRMFWLKRSYMDYVAGLYVCDGVQWNYTNDNDNLSAKFNAIRVNMDHNAEPNSVVLVDTSQNIVQVVLPLNPAVGDFVDIIDAVGSFNFNRCTVVRNGDPIRGYYENASIRLQNAHVRFTYTKTSNGWQYAVSR